LSRQEGIHARPVIRSAARAGHARRPFVVVLLAVLALALAPVAPAVAITHRHAGSPSTRRSHAKRHRARPRHRRHRTSPHRATPAAPPAAASSAATATSPAPAAPSAAPTFPSSGCGGEPLPARPTGGLWTCTFDDEFDASTGDAGSLDPSRWQPQITSQSGYATGPVATPACYVDSPDNISVSGGALHLTVRHAAAPVDCGGGVTSQYSSGMVTSDARFSQTYGRFEVRAQLPAATVAGLQETLWLWPANPSLYGGWPAAGEVDFAEFYSLYPSLDIPYLHYDPTAPDPASNTNVVTNYCRIEVGQYNTYAVVWEPGSFTISVNGATCLTDDYVASGLGGAAPFDQPFFVSLTQALGIGTNAFNPATTPLPATTSIDYVRVWR
jgi:beta-glucanase (GH16 family)